MTVTPEQTPVWERYVAIGDSFTEGMVDPDPADPNRFRGWADRLAEHLAAHAAEHNRPFSYANLAVRGRKLDDVVGAQLERALSMSPDLVSMVGGGNDILRPSVDLDLLADRLEEAVITIRETGADVLLSTPTDPRDAGLFKALRPRHAIHTANLFTIAQDHGCHIINMWGLKATRDWRMWGEDRIHPSALGHERITQAALLALGLPETDPRWREPLPPMDRASRREEFRDHAAWARTHAAPWVQRRLRGASSGDALLPKRPDLGPL
ncbi:MAG: SGNH/GDSL hydrolase family protein [Actinomycetia bacterium]|nr:SGNH/GDSL hydrolase family protein [Actinomycetes bacterium]